MSADGRRSRAARRAAPGAGPHWRTPLIALVAALALEPIAGGHGGSGLVVTACVLVAAWVVLDVRARQTPIVPLVIDVASPWAVLLVAGGALAASPFVAPRVPHVGPALVLGVAVVAAAAAAGMAVDRLRSDAVEFLMEVGTAAGAIAVACYLIVVRHWVPTDGVDLLLAYAGVAVAVAALLVLVRLVLVDRELRTGIAPLTATSLAACAAANVLGVRGALGAASSQEWRVTLGMVAASAAAAAFAHPARRPLQNPAAKVDAGRIHRRVIVLFGALLLGPSLIALKTFSRPDIPLGAVGISSAVLWVSVALYLFRILRRWDAVAHDVHHDSMTGLPNRQLFNTRLALSIEMARAHRSTMAVMFLDLDRFKSVNDSLGHEAGNSLLSQVAHRLQGSVGPEVTVARLGGDEFAVLVPEVRGYDHSVAIGQRILDAFGTPFSVGRRQVYSTPSIGIAHYPTDGVDPAQLLEHADAAMYRAKERGRNTIELYTAERRAQAVNRLDLESALHKAIECDELEVWYQPKVSLRSGLVTGVEALLRWRHPLHGMIPPGEFIPIAEETGLIGPLGEWVLLEACTQSRRWSDNGIITVPTAVNVSPRQFQLQPIPDLVARVLRSTSLPAAMLELELTESLALKDPNGASLALDDLRAMGVRCSIDDFGVGYSGLGYIDRFSFDGIKIDRKFVHSIDAAGAPIVTAVIAMANGLQLDVTAEGVETIEQRDFLQRHGCDSMQGFLFSKALPPDELEPLLRARRIVLPSGGERRRADDSVPAGATPDVAARPSTINL